MRASLRSVVAAAERLPVPIGSYSESLDLNGSS
jgi:hypothetical protein